MDIRVLLHYEYGTCYWRVISEAFYIDELFEISLTGQSCEDPNLVIDVPFQECDGTLTISVHREKLLELVEDADGCQRPFCGDCQCICETVCVIIDEGGILTYEEWDWDGSGWGRARLSRDEFTGECILSIAGYDPIILDQCDSGISFEFENYECDLIRGKCKLCKCDEMDCGDWCLDHGHSHPECDLPPYAIHYSVGPFELTTPESCYPFANLMPLVAETCRWEESQPPDKEVIFDLAGGILMYKIGEYTIIWRTAPGFNPLCPSFLVYDQDHPLNNPPPDCECLRRLCIYPSSVCCDNQDFRPVSMPNTLHGTLDYCCGEDQHLIASFAMGWNTATNRWESGEFTICNRPIRVTVRCECGTLEGCFSDQECYPVEFLEGDFPRTAQQIQDCSCYPFETKYLIELGWCWHTYEHTALLTITE